MNQRGLDTLEAFLVYILLLLERNRSPHRHRDWDAVIPLRHTYVPRMRINQKRPSSMFQRQVQSMFCRDFRRR